MENPKCPYCGRVMDAKCHTFNMWNTKFYFECSCGARTPMESTPEAAYAAADVKPVVRGEWVKVDDDLYRCSHCHSEIEMRDIYIAECKYCLVCGAEMRNRGEIDENAKRI